MESDEYDDLAKNPVEFIRDTVLEPFGIGKPREAMAIWADWEWLLKGICIYGKNGKHFRQSRICAGLYGWACAP